MAEVDKVDKVVSYDPTEFFGRRLVVFLLGGEWALRGMRFSHFHLQ